MQPANARHLPSSHAGGERPPPARSSRQLSASSGLLVPTALVAMIHHHLAMIDFKCARARNPQGISAAAVRD
jgi:hypothetical protein